MSSKNKIIEKNESNFHGDILKNKKKYNLIIIVLFLGLAVLISLYLNFQNIYKSPNKLDNESSTSKNIITNLSQKDPINQQQLSSNNNKGSDVNLQTISPEQPKIVQAKPENSCKDLLQFTQEFIALKNQVTSGRNFLDHLNNMNQFYINSDELGQNIENLLNYTHKNISYKYFQDKFKTLIKPIYKDSKNFLTFDVKDYILIRKINQRALNSNDLDKIVFIISEGLDNNDLSTVYENLQKLPHNSNLIENFKQEIQNKLNIESIIFNIESILLNNPDCSLVSK